MTWKYIMVSHLRQHREFLWAIYLVKLNHLRLLPIRPSDCSVYAMDTFLAACLFYLILCFVVSLFHFLLANPCEFASLFPIKEHMSAQLGNYWRKWRSNAPIRKIISSCLASSWGKTLPWNSSVVVSPVAKQLEYNLCMSVFLYFVSTLSLLFKN